MAEAFRSVVANDYLICRSTKKPDYSVWRIDVDGDRLLVPTQAGGEFDCRHQLIPIGSYILEWGPLTYQDYTADGGIFPYRLFRFDPNAVRPNSNIRDPLSVGAVFADPSSCKEKPTLVTRGIWPKKKFWWLVPDFGSPEGPAKEFMKGEKLMLVPLSTFILLIIPTLGRGTFKLFHFDRGSPDPLPPFPSEPPVFGSFETIQFHHELIPLGNYVLDWLPQTGEFWLWSFDSMNDTPLARPVIRQGQWNDINENHQLIPIGGHLLDWDMKDGRYRLWRFDLESENLLKMVRPDQTMPKEFDAKRTKEGGIEGHVLTGVQALRSIDETRKEVPGTIDFMRHKIKHVVYYMVENRSFDHVCGWLYENEKIPHLIGPDGPFKGIKHAQEQGRDYNIDPFTKEKVKVSTDGPDIAKFDPYHDMTDTMRQCFFMREHPFDNRDGYAKGTEPDMGGFVWNNGDKAVMSTCKPEQLPVLNGLARAFAVSDEWFCSMPGATDAQRAFALTGSALGELNNFMSGPEYSNWPYASHRGSIWKVLWANGFDDWKIYNSVEWFQFVLTYHLFLKGQIPTVDAETSAYLADNAPTSKYIGSIDQFMKDAKNGNLPAFSFLEPVWIEGGGSNKPATSYHPLGRSGAGSSEKALNDIYEALKAGRKWNETLLIITFDEHGGFFDHVPPPRAKNPWPHDTRDGFRYDLMGVRVPTILVSPWIEEGTVFRSEEVPYDSTSIMATLLRWYGIPRARWGLGERTHHAPTFENVFQCTSPRTDAPLIKPREEVCAFPERPSELHQQVIPRLISAICGEKVSGHESRKIADDILLHSASLTDLNVQITDLAKRMRRR